MMTPLMLLYAPFPDTASAEKAARALVMEQHVACCNLLPAVQSVYVWEGDLTQSTEWVLLAKTTRDRHATAMARLLALHPYENPAILAIPVADAPPAFAAWVQAQVRPPAA